MRTGLVFPVREPVLLLWIGILSATSLHLVESVVSTDVAPQTQSGRPAQPDRRKAGKPFEGFRVFDLDSAHALDRRRFSTWPRWRPRRLLTHGPVAPGGCFARSAARQSGRRCDRARRRRASTG